MMLRRCPLLLLLIAMLLVGVSAEAKRRKTKRVKPQVTTIFSSPDGEQWIRRGLKGIISICDSTGAVRSMIPFTASAEPGRRYAAAINDFADTLAAKGINTYMLIAPSQGEFYLPDAYRAAGERRAIAATCQELRIARGVEVADTLQAHVNEDIYLRTDHHWAPLGAYHAGREFARVANVPYRRLDEYQPDTIKGFIGTMAKFSGDIKIKSYPENLVYFRPPATDSLRAQFTVCGPKIKGDTASIEPFFKPFADGSPMAYCVFMGGDYVSVKVSNTGGPRGRRLLMIKDSYGNALAPCLFGSFEEVHILDFRYYPGNVASYCLQNGITDVLFINCISLANTPSTVTKLRGLLAPSSNEN